MGLILRIILSLFLFAVLFFIVGVLLLIPNIFSQISLLLLITIIASIPTLRYLNKNPSYITFIAGVLVVIIVLSLGVTLYNNERQKYSEIEQISENFTVYLPQLSNKWDEPTKIARSDESLDIIYSTRTNPSDASLRITEWKSSVRVECTVNILTSVGKGVKSYPVKDSDLVKNCEKLNIHEAGAVYSYAKSGISDIKHIIVWNESGTRIHMDGSGMEKEEFINIAKGFKQE